MNETSNQPEKRKSQYALNLTLAAVASQVGCLTLVIVLAALLGGLWLDNYFNTPRPVITVGLMVASVPVTLVAMFWVVKKATNRIQSETKTNSSQTQEETTRGREK